MDNRKSSTPAVTGDVATVFVAIELSGIEWLTALQSPRQEHPGRRKLAAADAAGLWALIERERSALQRAGWREVRVVTCYEAGRDGFWLHRFLVAQGAESWVVDPGSMLVNRRARRAKSDRLDVESLLRVVMRHDAGDCSLGRMVVVPSLAEEDARRPGRERQRLLSERTAHSNRIQALLALHGVYGYRPLRSDPGRGWQDYTGPTANRCRRSCRRRSGASCIASSSSTARSRRWRSSGPRRWRRHRRWMTPPAR